MMHKQTVCKTPPTPDARRIPTMAHNCQQLLLAIKLQIALKGQDLPCMYLARHELEMFLIIVIVNHE